MPVREDVRAACELLGLDPAYVANEGRFIAILPATEVEEALRVLHLRQVSADAVLIGRAEDGPAGRVTVRGPLRGHAHPRYVERRAAASHLLMVGARQVADNRHIEPPSAGSPAFAASPTRSPLGRRPRSAMSGEGSRRRSSAPPPSRPVTSMSRSPVAGSCSPATSIPGTRRRWRGAPRGRPRASPRWRTRSRSQHDATAIPERAAALRPPAEAQRTELYLRRSNRHKTARTRRVPSSR